MDGGHGSERSSRARDASTRQSKTLPARFISAHLGRDDSGGIGLAIDPTSTVPVVYLHSEASNTDETHVHAFGVLNRGKDTV
jgi:hypothetical protein